MVMMVDEGGLQCKGTSGGLTANTAGNTVALGRILGQWGGAFQPTVH